jgi:hypothetical protein
MACWPTAPPESSTARAQARHRCPSTRSRSVRIPPSEVLTAVAGVHRPSGWAGAAIRIASALTDWTPSPHSRQPDPSGGRTDTSGSRRANWSRTVLDVGVAYDSDVAEVRRLMGEEAHRLFAEEDWTAVLLEEPEVRGVESLGHDSVVVRLVLKTHPGEQWRVARELRERITARFDAEGIEIPFPQRTVWGAQRRHPAGGPAGAARALRILITDRSRSGGSQPTEARVA